MTDHSSNKTVRAEIIDDSTRMVPQQVLAEASQRVRFSSGVVALLQPKERREIAARLQHARLGAVVDLAVERLHRETDSRIVEIELAAEQRRASILAAQNERMGDLKQQQLTLTGKALQDEIVAEHRDQIELRSADMFDSDRQILAELYRQRTANSLARIAGEHGLCGSKSASTAHTADDEHDE